MPEPRAIHGSPIHKPKSKTQNLKSNPLEAERDRGDRPLTLPCPERRDVAVFASVDGDNALGVAAKGNS